MTATLDSRRVEALQFAGALRGATTKEEVLLWGLQCGYFLERTTDSGTSYHLTESGADYADKWLAETKPTGGVRWLPPALALGALALLARRLVRR